MLFNIEILEKKKFGYDNMVEKNRRLVTIQWYSVWENMKKKIKEHRINTHIYINNKQIRITLGNLIEFNTMSP